MPADTRIPDHSVWTHTQLVSALDGCADGVGTEAVLKPAFLKFQLGPVQEFIAEARSIRDLWSGSYLLLLAQVCGNDGASNEGRIRFGFQADERMALGEGEAGLPPPPSFWPMSRVMSLSRRAPASSAFAQALLIALVVCFLLNRHSPMRLRNASGPRASTAAWAHLPHASPSRRPVPPTARSCRMRPGCG
ncbi:MAG TPA: type III-B CRISPR-associated protein Cas10/Cmr2 [Chthoniobacterales bacterium]